MAERPWYKEFFEQDYLDGYGPLLTPERTLQDVDFIDKTLLLPPASHILDLCCGHGRHLVELAAREYQMTGLDLNARFLEMANEEAELRGLQVRLEHRDMRDIPFLDEFHAVINMFTAFGYLENDDEDQKVLDGVSRCLRKGGQFLMELMNRDTLMRIFRDTRWNEADSGVMVLEHREFDHLAGRNNVAHITIYPDGRQVTRHHSLRVYTLTEIAKMLERAGLKVEATYGSTDGTPFTLDSRRLVIHARKAE